MKRAIARAACALLPLLLTACEPSPGDQGPVPAARVEAALADPAKLGADVDAKTYRQRLDRRGFDPAQVVRGRELFVAHCASCHGQLAEGAPNWQKRGPGGTWPPPPLNGTAHDWHHSDQLLLRIMRDGGLSYGEFYRGAMPPMGDKLDEADRLAVLRYIQSLWSDEAWTLQQQLTRENPGN